MLLAALAAACSPAASGEHAPVAARPPQPDSPAPPSAPEPELEASEWGAIVSVRQSLELSLPERKSWRVNDVATPWLVAQHEPTRSELVARTWRAPRRVKRDECEKQARLWRPGIPAAPAESVMETRQIDAPEGFHSELTVGVEPTGQPGHLRGFAMAFGATVGRCYALVYTTHAFGPRAEAAIGRRLALVADHIVPRARFRSIDQRVR